MRVGFSSNVQPFGRIELVAVMVRCQKGNHDEFVCGYFHLADPDRNGSESGRCDVERALESQELFHGIRKPRRLGAQERELGWIPQQRQNSVSDEVHRGLVSGQDEQVCRCQQLVFGQLIAVVGNP